MVQKVKKSHFYLFSSCWLICLDCWHAATFPPHMFVNLDLFLHWSLKPSTSATSPRRRSRSTHPSSRSAVWVQIVGFLSRANHWEIFSSNSSRQPSCRQGLVKHDCTAPSESPRFSVFTGLENSPNSGNAPKTRCWMLLPTCGKFWDGKVTFYSIWKVVHPLSFTDHISNMAGVA